MPSTTTPLSVGGRRSSLLALVAVLGLACGGGSTSTPAPPAPPATGTAGGTVTEPSGASVVVPPGALTGDVAIQIAKDSTGAPALPSGLASAGATYVITPHGGDFALPVEVRIPAPGVTLLPTQELKLAKAQPGGEWLVLGDSTLADGVLSAQVGSFSFFVPVVVTYPVSLVVMAPLQVTTSLGCGGQACTGLLGAVTATFTVATNSGQLPANCVDGRLVIQGGNASSFQGGGLNQTIPLSGGSSTRTLQPLVSSYNSYSFFAGLACGSYARSLSDASTVSWKRPPVYPGMALIRVPGSLDVVEGSSASLEVVLSGGAVKNESGLVTATPTGNDRAIIDWQRSDDGGGSWHPVGRSYQDEANPNPAGEGYAWRWWGVRHGFIASAADQGALLRVHACYTPPDVPAPPCVTGPATRLNVLQQGTPPTITTQPASLNVVAGSDAAFAVAAQGSGTLGFQWSHDGTPITGATGPVLRLSGVTGGGAGSYGVVVSNAAGNVASQVAILTVGPAVSAPVAPTIVTQPVSVLVNSGNTATFAVGVSGSPPLAYQWKRDFADIPGATAAFYSIASTAVGDAGTYSVVVSNGAGSDTSSNVRLTVNETPLLSAPVITTQPAMQVLQLGGSATFAVAASGTGPLTYQWSLDGAPIAGATGAVLLLDGVGPLDAGSYTVTVGNLMGALTSNPAQLILVGAPSITAQPADVTAVEGNTATFSVTATGAALRYQWQRNGVIIAGATASSHTTPATTLADSGAVYSVLVYNGAGLVLSQPAVLTVSAAPILTIPTLVSLTTIGTVPNNRSTAPSLSADGRRVAFRSDGTNLVAGAGVFGHAYLRDLGTNTTSLINARPDGGGSAGAVVSLKLAAGGRYAVFTSLANDLVAGDTNNVEDVFLRDLQAGTTTRLNVMPDGSQDVVSGNAQGRPIDISADGRWVLMTSAVNLTGDGALLPTGPRLFLRDTQAGVTRTLAGVGGSGAAALSASGRFIAIVLASGAGPSFANDLLVYDVEANTTTTALSVSAAAFPDGIYGTPSITDDGRFVAFGLRSSTLLAGQAAAASQIVVLDLAQPDPALALTMQSLTSGGAVGDGPSAGPQLSGDGRFLIYLTNAPNLAGDPAATFRNYLMVRDRQLQTTRVASRRVNGSNVWVVNFGHALSGDGSVLAYVADMADMVSPTTLGEYQVFAAPRP